MSLRSRVKELESRMDHRMREDERIENRIDWIVEDLDLLFEHLGLEIEGRPATKVLVKKRRKGGE